MIIFRSVWIILGTILVLSAIPISAQELRTDFTELVPGIEIHTSYRMLGNVKFPSNGLIVHTQDSVVLIDTGWGIGPTHEVLDHIKDGPIAACIITDYHDDRSAGIPVLQAAGIRSMGTALTRSLAAQHDEPVPDLELSSDTTIMIDGLQFTIFHPGAGHTEDNIVVWLPERKVLFGGCFIKSTEAGTLGNIADADLDRWPASVRRVQQRFPDALHVIPGHHQWGGPELFDHTLRLLEQR